MKKFFVNLVCAFIFSKKKRDIVRRKLLHQNAKVMCNQWDIFSQNNHIEICEEDKTHINLSIQGKGNTVLIKKLCSGITGKINISLAGNNCRIIIDEGVWVSGFLNIGAGQIHPNFGAINNTSIFIGKKTSFETCNITLFNSNSVLEIGEQCMFSFGINIFHTDAHPIYNLDKTKILNKVKTLKIGNHTWVGANVSILKNCIIPDDCIIGWGSVVSSKSCIDLDAHCALSGNPAVVVKRNVTWDSDGSKGYIQNI